MKIGSPQLRALLRKNLDLLDLSDEQLTAIMEAPYMYLKHTIKNKSIDGVRMKYIGLFRMDRRYANTIKGDNAE